MLARLSEQLAAGEIDQEIADIVKKVLQTPGHVRLTPPDNHHQARLVPLIARLATRLHLDTLVAVRRFSEPLLFTGAEPVVVFPDADMSHACSWGKFLTGGERPVEVWQEPDELWAQLEGRLSTIAGLAVAADPHTALLMFSAGTDEGGKLAFIASRIQGEALAGLMGLFVAGGSAWVAGRDDCRPLGLVVQAAERALCRH